MEKSSGGGAGPGAAACGRRTSRKYADGTGVPRVRSCAVAGRHRESPRPEGQDLGGQEPDTPHVTFAADTSAGSSHEQHAEAARSWQVGGMRWGLVLLIGAVAAPVVTGGAIAMAVRNGGDEKGPIPSAAATRAAPPPVAPRPRPRVYPTYGEYVPPRPVAAPAPSRPSVKPTQPTRTPEPTRARPTCPSDWERVPWLRRWCQTHGYEVDDS